MTYATTSEFRSNMSNYLEEVRKWEVLYLWRRNKKEFVIVPTSLIDEEDIEIMQSKYLAEKIAKARKSKRYSLDEVKKSLWIDI